MHRNRAKIHGKMRDRGKYVKIEKLEELILQDNRFEM